MNKNSSIGKIVSRTWHSSLFGIVLFIIFPYFAYECQAKKIKMKCITLNLRFDNKGDGINKWDNRKERVSQFLNDEAADIICLQEVLDRQLNDLDGFLDGYAHVGVGRDDGKTRGEYAPIFYKKEKYEKLENGYFWLSEHPDSIGSVGWDASLPRIVTWIKLKDKKKDRIFVVINTHFDHIGRKARLQSAELIKRWVYENVHSLPVILAGDLNVTEKSEAYRSLTDDGSPFVDASKICKKREGVGYSFHNFGKLQMFVKSKIDYIFVSSGIKVKSVCIPHEDPIEGVYLSDHNPIVAHILIK